MFFIGPPIEDSFVANREFAGGLGVKEKRATTETDVLLPSLEMLTAASVARQAGHQITFEDYAVSPFDIDGLLAKLDASCEPIVIAPVALATIRDDCDFLAMLKARRPKLRICLLTALDHAPVLRRALETSGADVALSFEAIPSLDAIIEGADTRNTVRLAGDGTLQRGAKVPLSDLDRLPAPDWSLVKDKGYAYTLKSFPRTDFVPLQTSVGCPFPCGYYCPYPLTQGTKVRMHSLPWVIDRLTEIAALGFCGVVFRDPVFTLSRRRTVALCAAMIEHAIDLRWACETRIDCLDDELMALMARAGCVGIEVGVESGNREVMQKQGKPGLVPENVTAFAALARRHGIEASFLFVIGLPIETKTTIADTFRLIEASGIDPDQLNFSVITPYPGTRLFDDATRHGWVSREWDAFSGYQPVMRTDNLSIEEIDAARGFAVDFVDILGRRDSADGAGLDAFYERLGDWARQAPA